jgi:hypothetical protein
MAPGPALTRTPLAKQAQTLSNSSVLPITHNSLPTSPTSPCVRSLPLHLPPTCTHDARTAAYGQHPTQSATQTLAPAYTYTQVHTGNSRYTNHPNKHCIVPVKLRKVTDVHQQQHPILLRPATQQFMFVNNTFHLQHRTYVTPHQSCNISGKSMGRTCTLNL